MGAQLWNIGTGLKLKNKHHKLVVASRNKSQKLINFSNFKFVVS